MIDIFCVLTFKTRLVDRALIDILWGGVPVQFLLNGLRSAKVPFECILHITIFKGPFNFKVRL